MNPQDPLTIESIAQELFDRFFMAGATVRKGDYDFIISKLKEYGKAEREKGKRYWKLEREIGMMAAEEAEKVGYTKGIEDAKEAIEILPAKTFKSPAEKHEIVIALESLKNKP